MKKRSGKTAIVGMSGIFPGAGEGNLSRFCDNVMDGHEAICDVPPDRWTLPPEAVLSTGYQPDSALTNRAGIVTGFHFDPSGLPIPADLLLQLDPLQQMVLHTGRDALSQCHVPAHILEKTGVVLAAIALPTERASDLSWRIVLEKVLENERSLKGGSLDPARGRWHSHPFHSHDLTHHEALNGFHPQNPITAMDAIAAGMVSVPAALLARVFGFRGGCFTLDAACASSLYAVKIACDQLHSGKSDMMIAGGVSRPDPLYTQIGFTQLKALSPSGRCSPFDRNADGLVVGEGAGLVILKRLEDALQCGDTIYGVIAGCGWSNDIEGNLVAPASEGQIRAMAMAYRNAGWSPGDVQHIECHGSATPVGDTVELNSMATLWKNAGLGDRGCAIGSVKSMTGHLLTAAGAAGLIKTLLALNEKKLPPSINFFSPTDDSPLRTTGFHVQTKPEPWEPCPLLKSKIPNGKHGNSMAGSTSSSSIHSTARRAGVSAFGFGGINAHLLVEEYKKPVVRQFLPSQFANENPTDGNTIQNDKPFIAIVGMACITKPIPNLEAFNRHLHNSSDSAHEQILNLFMDEFITHAGAFHIPPNQIDDILPQHLILLKTAIDALEDAKIPKRAGKEGPDRTRFGAAIGIDFDYGATDFHLRWREKKERIFRANHHGRSSATPDYGNSVSISTVNRHGRTLATPELENDTGIFTVNQKPSHIMEPLTHNRTLGALGGIVASRVAREFKLGGPCFTLSAGAESAMKALEIATASIQSGETDIFLCGCVDMAGDLRQMTLNQTLRHYINGHGWPSTTPDHEKEHAAPSTGIIPSEGAGAIVLKSLEQAQKDGDRIYAVIKGMGTASGGPLSIEPPPSPTASTNQSKYENNFASSLMSALKASGLVPADITHYQLHGSGDKVEQAMEAKGVAQVGIDLSNLTATSTASPFFAGDTHAASGMLSLIHGALSIHLHDSHNRDEKKKERVSSPIACIAAMTPLGCASHVILTPPPLRAPDSREKPHDTERKRQGPKGAEKIIKVHKFPAKVAMGQPSPHDNLQPFNNMGTNRETDQGIETQQKTGSHPESILNKTVLTNETNRIVANSHIQFLALSEMGMAAMADQYRTLTELASAFAGCASTVDGISSKIAAVSPKAITPLQRRGENPSLSNEMNRVSMQKKIRSASHLRPLFDKAMCMEFAVGEAGNVLGERFRIIDSYPVRVRLPDTPLMLVDRILSIEGEPCSLSSGRIVTEHDVLPGAWYLDGGKAPVSIAIEAGQADLFLSSYLGIDHVVQGRRRYRLLDAKVTFHRTLPEPEETITYHIEIDRFLKQGEIYLFFFHYKGYIGSDLLISMRDGCAGFFTLEEVENSGGIILKNEDRKPHAGQRGYLPPPSLKTVVEHYDDDQVEALRKGDLGDAFGKVFQGMKLGHGMHLPGGRMHLIDRVLELNPVGGRFGLGLIRAEADIDPDAWFLTCHFVDDMVMPGTLMYECCAHALRIFTLRMGWISLRDECRYDIIPGIESDLKCRGPVTRETKKARYEIEVKEMGFMPEPYVIADAHMFSDDHRIVLYKNMGMKIQGLSRDEIEKTWQQ